jgi:hypothetical protein
MSNDTTPTCAKCFRCRIVLAKPRSETSDLLAKSAVRRIYCAEGHFPYDFVSITEFNTSSVRRRAESCADYDPSESMPHVIEKQPEVFSDTVTIKPSQ